MCNRYRALYNLTDLLEDFSQIKIPLRFPDGMPNLEPRADVRPTNTAAIIRPFDPADPLAGVGLSQARWWLVPFFHKGPVKAWKPMGTNARSETCHSTPMFREAYRRRRCLVPADGFYEWTGDKGAKTKWLFTHATQPRFMFAGLWDRCDNAGDPTETFTILTTAAGPDMADYHDRQPVILERADWGRWLDTAGEVGDLFAARPAGTIGAGLAEVEG